MNGREKSGLGRSSREALRTNRRAGGGAGGAKGRDQGNAIPRSTLRTQGRAGRVTGAGSHTGSCGSAHQGGEVHCAPAPRHTGSPAGRVPAIANERGRRDRRNNVAGTMKQTSSVSSRTCMTESRAGRIGRRRAGGFTYPKLIGGHRPLRWRRRWRTRSFSAPWPTWRMRSTRKTSLASATDPWPGRGAHDALDAPSAAIYARKVNYIVDARHCEVLRLGEQRMARPVPRTSQNRRQARSPCPIQKWLSGGAFSKTDGSRFLSGERGQGAAISLPLLANVYLHYVLDPWAESAGDGVRGSQGRAWPGRTLRRRRRDLRLRVGDRRPPLPGCGCVKD